VVTTEITSGTPGARAGTNQVTALYQQIS